MSNAFNSPSSGTTTEADRREHEPKPHIAGIIVREDDIERVKGIRAVSMLFRGMAILLLVLMVAQVFFAVTSTVPLSVGVVFAEAVRLVIFAGLLWAAGELAVLWVKSHHDIRATRILSARTLNMLRQMGESAGHLKGGSSDPAAGEP